MCMIRRVYCRSPSLICLIISLRTRGFDSFDGTLETTETRRSRDGSEKNALADLGLGGEPRHPSNDSDNYAIMSTCGGLFTTDTASVHTTSTRHSLGLIKEGGGDNLLSFRNHMPTRLSHRPRVCTALG